MGQVITYFNKLAATTRELETAKSLTPIGGFKTTFAVTTLPAVDTACSGITSAMLTSLTTAGYSKAVCPFGILMVGTDVYDDSYLQYAANVAANFMDPDHDGVANNDAAKGYGLNIANRAKTAVSLAFLGGDFTKDNVAYKCSLFSTSTDLKYCNGLE